MIVNKSLLVITRHRYKMGGAGGRAREQLRVARQQRGGLRGLARSRGGRQFLAAVRRGAR